MSINIFQFLKQGTSLNRNSLKLNQQLQQKIAPVVKNPNLTYFQTGKFNESDEEDDQDAANIKLSEQAMKAHEQKMKEKSKYLRKIYKIKASGIDIPDTMDNFTKLIKKYKLHPGICKGLASMGLTKPTPIQMLGIPALLQDRNLLVTAPTGTGKTLSYLIPVLQHCLKFKAKTKKNVNKKEKTKQSNKNSGQLQTVILVPFQQLSTQVKQQMTNVCNNFQSEDQQKVKFACISEITEQQKNNLKEGKPLGVNILITTPMSFINLFDKIWEKKNPFGCLKHLIMDQCDKYFEESFLEQIRKILEIVNSAHPTYGLYSATIQHPVEQLLKSQLLEDSIRIQVGGKNKVLSKVTQSIEYCTNQYGKLIELKNMISQNKFVPPALIFVQEKSRAKQLYYEMKKILKNTNGGMNISKRVEVLSGDKNKEERQKILDDFEKGIYWILITTDLVARGIDFQQVNLVINYDFPNSMLTYIHRVGRTGRADRIGTAITFFTEEDKPIVRSLANLLQASGCDVPEWILHLPKPDRKTKKKLQKYPTKRLPVGVAEGKDKNWDQELQKLQKKWQRIKERQIQKDRKKQQEQGEDQGQWIQA